MSGDQLELVSGCGRYKYSVVCVYQQTARHKISDMEPVAPESEKASLGMICEKMDTGLNLTSPPRPCSSGVFTSAPILNSPTHPQLFINRIDTDSSQAPLSPLSPLSPNETSKNVSLNSEVRSPIKSMRPRGKLTKNKRVTKGTRPTKKLSKDTKKILKLQNKTFDLNVESSPESDSDLDSKLDAYFISNSKRCVTSNNTLADMPRPKLNHQEVNKIISSTPSLHLQQLKDNLFRSHTMKFHSWSQLLSLGMNVILYGFGSKQGLIEAYRREYLSNCNHLVINGFFPTLSIKSILTKISSDVLGSDVTFRSLSEHYTYIINEFHTRDCPDFYIIVHNICSTGLQMAQTQLTLSQLATCKRIHFLASIDTFKGLLLWDQGVLSRFKWVWQYCPTYASYTDETSYENSFFVKQSGSVALSALVHVMASLTPNARSIFKLLTQQLETETADKKHAAAGIPFYDLYVMCRANFLVNSERTLRAQLTEFRDHKLIKSKKGKDGVEHLKISVDKSTLKVYFEEHFET